MPRATEIFPRAIFGTRVTGLLALFWGETVGFACLRKPGLCCTSARGFRHPFSENAGQKLFANRPDIPFLILDTLLFAFTG